MTPVLNAGTVVLDAVLVDYSRTLGLASAQIVPNTTLLVDIVQMADVTAVTPVVTALTHSDSPASRCHELVRSCHGVYRVQGARCRGEKL